MAQLGVCQCACALSCCYTVKSHQQRTFLLYSSLRYKQMTSRLWLYVILTKTMALFNKLELLYLLLLVTGLHYISSDRGNAQ